MAATRGSFKIENGLDVKIATAPQIVGPVTSVFSWQFVAVTYDGTTTTDNLIFYVSGHQFFFGLRLFRESAAQCRLRNTDITHVGTIIDRQQSRSHSTARL